ncbi:MAG: hypothetical protein GY839_03600 [candidate division Zixibacteria bacterium]|nr:hypothetical protein [candidate division Zixibacteria bacterium]
MLDQPKIINTISKATVIGTMIVFVTNIACLAICFVGTEDKARPEEYGPLTIILGAIALIELGIGFYIKRKLMAPLHAANQTPSDDLLWQVALKTTIALAAICAAIPLYGLVAVIIEGNINAMVGFAIVSLAGFLFLRLRPRDFSKLEYDN